MAAHAHPSRAATPTAISMRRDSAVKVLGKLAVQAGTTYSPHQGVAFSTIPGEPERCRCTRCHGVFALSTFTRCHKVRSQAKRCNDLYCLRLLKRLPSGTRVAGMSKVNFYQRFRDKTRVEQDARLNESRSARRAGSDPDDVACTPAPAARPVRASAPAPAPVAPPVPVRAPVPAPAPAPAPVAKPAPVAPPAPVRAPVPAPVAKPAPVAPPAPVRAPVPAPVARMMQRQAQVQAPVAQPAPAPVAQPVRAAAPAPAPVRAPMPPPAPLAPMAQPVRAPAPPPAPAPPRGPAPVPAYPPRPAGDAPGWQAGVDGAMRGDGRWGGRYQERAYEGMPMPAPAMGAYMPQPQPQGAPPARPDGQYITVFVPHQVHPAPPPMHCPGYFPYGY